MAHEILASIGKIAHWHGQNEVFPDGLTASEGLEVIGKFEVKKCKPFLTCPFTGEVLQTEKAFVVREPLTKWNEVKGVVLGGKNGLVHDRFVVIDPQMAVDAWMEAVKAPNGQPVKVDAMGYLGKGERMWITAQFDPFFVEGRKSGKGTEILPYCLFYNPLSPNAAAFVRNTDIMVVCANTAYMSDNNHNIQIEIPHYDGAYERLVAALKGIWQGRIKATQSAIEISNKLVAIDLPEKQFEDIVNALFKVRNAPNPNRVCKTPIDQRIAAWEWHVSFVKAQREKVMELYRGGAMGISEGFEGTAYGAYMALTEYATYYGKQVDEDTAEEKLLEAYDDKFKYLSEGDGYKLIQESKIKLLELA